MDSLDVENVGRGLTQRTLNDRGEEDEEPEEVTVVKELVEGDKTLRMDSSIAYI